MLRGQLARQCLDWCQPWRRIGRRVLRLLRATEHLSWSQTNWRNDLARWLQRSSPKTFTYLVKNGLLDAHLERLLQTAQKRYMELRKQGASWRQARRILEQELAGQIGTVVTAAPSSGGLSPVNQVPSNLHDWLPDNLREWLPELESTLRQAAPEGYAEAKRRGLLEAHLENIVHWACDQLQLASAGSSPGPCLERLFEAARQRAICMDWQTPVLRHDPNHWAEDIIHFWRSVSPERCARWEASGQLYLRAEHIANQLRNTWRSFANCQVDLAQWLAFARAALVWSQHPWQDLISSDRFRSLTVDIVGSCNARCPFCPRVAMPAERSKGFMDFELFRRILRRGREQGISQLYLYSTGEPTLHPRFDDFVALAKDLGYFVVCSTNGSMIHQRLRGLTLADTVQLSIEGWDRVSYERYRYPLRFDRVYGNVQEYAACRPPSQRYVVNCLLTRKTDIEQYALLWGQFFDEIVFHPMYPTAGVLDGQHRAIPEPSLADDYWWFESAVVPTCSDPFDTLTISFDGKRVLCCQDFSASLPLGHADDDWDTLYRHPIFERVRQEFRSQSFTTCQGCGNLVKLPEPIKAALLEEIHRVWQTHHIRARPVTASLQADSLDLEAANWLKRIALQALRPMPTTYSQANSRGPDPPSQPASRSVSLHVISSSSWEEVSAGQDHLPTTYAAPPPSEVGLTSKRTVLILVTEVAEFTALVHLAEHLRQSGTWHPILYFTEPYPLLTKHVLCCRQRQFPVWAGPRVVRALRRPGLFDNSAGADIELAPLDAQQQALLDWCHSLHLPELDGHLTMLRYELASFRNALQQIQPQCLVLGEENVSKYTPLYSRTAEQQGVGSLIVPWCLASREGFELALSAIPLYDATSDQARVFCTRFPQWRLSRSKELLRAPVYEAAALQILNCAPENPWAFQSGFASMLAVESPWMMEHYLRQGVPDHRLRLTGSWCDDDLHAGLRHWQDKRRQLCRELHLDPNRPLLLAALPSNQMPNRQRYTEFSSYAELLSFWAQSLASLPECQTVLVTHPSVSPAAWRHLERDNVRFSDKPTYELMPLADALVACVSSIIRWALACGLPVLDYDVYRFGYTYFQDEAQVKAVQTRQDFTHALKELAANIRPGQHVPPDGVRVSPWGLLDGQSVSRISSLMNDLATHTLCNLADITSRAA